MSIFADYQTLSDNFDPSNRDTILDTELEEIVSVLNSMNDDDL